VSNNRPRTKEEQEEKEKEKKDLLSQRHKGTADESFL